MMKTYQVDIKETLCMAVEIETINEHRPKKKFGRRTKMKIASLIQNTLPVWNLQLKK